MFGRRTTKTEKPPKFRWDTVLLEYYLYGATSAEHARRVTVDYKLSKVVEVDTLYVL